MADTTVKIVVDGAQAINTLKDLTKANKDFEASAKSSTAAMNDAGKATDDMAKAAMRARPHLIQLVQDLAEGRGVIRSFSAQGVDIIKTFGSVGETMRALGGVIMSPIGLFGILAAALGTVAVAAIKGGNELESLRNQLNLTGNFAGVTAGSIEVLANSLAGGSVTGNAMSEALGKIAGSGRVAGPGLQELGKAIQKVADMSGESADKVGGVLVKAFEGNIHVIQDLNNQYHFLNAEQFAHIDNLIRQGKYQQAGTETMKAFNEKIKDQSKEVGFLGRMWDNLTQSVSNFWSTLKNLGKDDVANRVEDLRKNLTTLDAAIKRISDIPEDKRTPQQINLLKTLVANRIEAARSLGEEENKLDKENAIKKKESDRAIADQEKILRDQANKGLGYSVELEKKRIDFAQQKAALDAKAAQEGSMSVAAARAELTYQEKIATLEAERRRANELEPMKAGNTNARISALKEIAKVERDGAIETARLTEETRKKEFTDLIQLHGEKLREGQSEVDQGEIVRAQLKNRIELEDKLRKELARTNDPNANSSYGQQIKAQIELEKIKQDAIIQTRMIEQASNDITGKLRRKLTEDTNSETDALKSQRDIMLASTVIDAQVIQKNIELRKQEEAEILKIQSLFGNQDSLNADQIAKQQSLTDALHKQYDKRRKDAEESLRSDNEIRSTSLFGIDEAFAKISKMAKTPAEMASSAVDVMFNDMNKALDNFVTTGKGSFADFAKSVVQDLIKIEMKEQVISLFKGVSSASGGGTGILSFFSNLFKAEGGPVNGGQSYIVGEKGPEIFTPSSGGSITPNNKIGNAPAAAQTIVTYNINAVDSMSFQQMLARDPSFIYALSLQGQKALPSTRI